MSRISAYTLIELLIVVAIVAIIAGIVFPVFASAKRAAKQTASMAHLRQIHLAVSMYREEQPSSASYGSISAMGLPYLETVMRTGLGVPQDVWLSPCVGPDRDLFSAIPREQRPAFLLEYVYAPTSSIKWENYVTREAENAVIFWDPYCADEVGDRWVSPYRRYRAIGLFLGGHTKVYNRHGDPWGYEYWCTVPGCSLP